MESAVTNRDVPGWLAAHEQIRAESYVMLAALLEQAPSEDLLNVLQNLQWDEALPGALNTALRELRQAGRS